MSDNTPAEIQTAPVTIGDAVFQVTEISEPGRKSKKNPTPAPTIYVRPVLNGLDEHVAFVKSLLVAECLEILALVSLERRDPAAYLAELEKQGLTEDQYVVKCLSVQQRLADVSRAHREAQEAKAIRAANRAAKQAKDAGAAAV